MQSLRVHRAYLQDAGGAALPCMRAWGDEVSDYMQEAKRLIDELGRCRWAAGTHDGNGAFGRANTCDRGADRARAALLAHIERGRVPDVSKPAAWAVSGQDLSDYSLWLNELDEEQLEILNAQCKDGPVIVRPLVFAAPAAPDHSAAKPSKWRPLTSDEIVAEVLPPAEVPMPESAAYLYTLEYGQTTANRKVSQWKLNYPFGVCGADYLAQSGEGVSYVRETPMCVIPVVIAYGDAREAAGYARGIDAAVAVLMKYAPDVQKFGSHKWPSCSELIAEIRAQKGGA